MSTFIRLFITNQLIENSLFLIFSPFRLNEKLIGADILKYKHKANWKVVIKNFLREFFKDKIQKILSMP